MVSPVGEEAFAPRPYGVVNVAQPARMEIVSPSGGGWGDPLVRDAERVWRDVRDGMVSEPTARDVYGVVIADGELDSAATESHRAELSGGR